jgi:hypothetical protein
MRIKKRSSQYFPTNLLRPPFINTLSNPLTRNAHIHRVAVNPALTPLPMPNHCRITVQAAESATQ